MAHVWYYLYLYDNPQAKEEFIAKLVKQFLAEADKEPGRFPRIRELCREYRYGNEAWAGMWIPPHDSYDGRWNTDEIWAGLASGSMGDLTMFPTGLRNLYGQMFQEPYLVYMPVVMAQDEE